MTAKKDVNNDLVVDAQPERALFVQMLTRDIELIPAIMDLVDNSIDGARAQSGTDLSDYWINLSVSPDRFEISDNCGGIDLDTARKYAFRFGRPSEYKGTKGSVGQFGVGMKRALFKLGRTFRVESRAETTNFDMTVDVNEWMLDTDPKWTFEMQSASRSYDSEAGGRGTTITVTDMHQPIAEDLSEDRYLSILREQIRFRHQGPLNSGISITLNDDRLTGLERELMSGPNFAPINRTSVVKSDYGDVAVRIIAGITTLDKKDIGKDDGNAESFRRASDAGWWIFCNDRLLIMRDHTRLTGWGENLPNYHPQYRQFRGYAYMTAAETAALPWNTTKTGIDEESRVWRQVQGQIKAAGAEVISIINRMKTESETALEPDDMPTVDAFRDASLVDMDKLDDSEHFVAPPPRSAKSRPKKRKTPTKKLQFEVVADHFEAVARQLGTDVVAEVGRRTFDYYYEREINT